MERITMSEVKFLKARMLRPVGEDPHHKAYTRIKGGKLQRIPQKGAILQERGEIPKEGARDRLGNDYARFSKDLDDYFSLDVDLKKLKKQVEEYATKKEGVMSRIRPLLSKFENLSKEENKFQTEFEASGFKHKFLSYPRETLPYKDLFEESFKRLTAKMQDEMNGLKGTLKRITAMEKFERIEKSSSDKIADYLKNIIRLKEEAIKHMKTMDATIHGRLEKSLFVIVEEE